MLVSKVLHENIPKLNLNKKVARDPQTTESPKVRTILNIETAQNMSHLLGNQIIKK